MSNSRVAALQVWSARSHAALPDVDGVAVAVAAIPLIVYRVLKEKRIMNAGSHSKTITTAIAANLAALNDPLTTAAKRSAEAHALAQSGECNGAIGAMFDLDSILDDAKALHRAVVTLHRTKRF
jgi:hypothetical protein